MTKCDHCVDDKTIPEARRVFARNFKRARLAAGLTQNDIHMSFGFAQSFISDLERCRTTINLDNMADLSRAVGIPLWELLKP